MAKTKIEFKCSKCGKPQPKDEKQSNENWEVYACNQKCECGGKFTMFLDRQTTEQ